MSECKYGSNENLEKLIKKYFAKCDARTKQVVLKDSIKKIKDPAPYTIPGLAYHLGYTHRNAIWRIINKYSSKEASNILKRAVLKIEDQRATGMIDGTKSVVGSIFDFKANFGWNEDGPDTETADQAINPPNIINILTEINNQYQVAEVHYKLAQRLDNFVQDFRAGRAPRLHINMPPRHGKTTLAEGAVLKALGLMPAASVAWLSYAQPLALRSSRLVRDMVDSDLGRGLFGDLRGGSIRWGAEEWKLAKGGGLIARGTGGGITGQNVNLLVLDDLVKNYQDYLSLTKRERLDQFFQADLAQRLENNTAILSIGTRWGVEDAIHKALKYLPGKWDILTFPALADGDCPLGRSPGEALFPDRVGVDLLEQIQQRIGEVEWAAIYQQNPIDTAGRCFKIERFRYIEPSELPRNILFLRYWDWGFDEDPACPSATALVGLAENRDMYIAHVMDLQKEWPDVRKIVGQTREQDSKENPAIRLMVEAIGTQKGYWQDLNDIGCPCDGRFSKPDKVTEAKLWQSIQWSGKVHLVKGAWNQKFVDQCHEFPLGTYNDMVDAVSQAHHMLQMGTGGMVEIM